MRLERGGLFVWIEDATIFIGANFCDEVELDTDAARWLLSTALPAAIAEQGRQATLSAQSVPSDDFAKVDGQIAGQTTIDEALGGAL